MNNQRSIRTGMGRSVATAALVLGALWSAPAYAVAPANTTVTNTATLTYTGDATGIQASVDFKVTLKASPPSLGSGPIAGGGVALSLTGPGDNTVVAGQASSATYIITANANGPDTYNLTESTTYTDTDGSGPATYSPTSVTLGATAVAVAGTGATITVPADGTANSSINGIVNGDYVAIGGNVYVVSNVTDNATGTSTFDIDTSITVAVGDPIGEVKEFTMNIANVGLVTPLGTPDVTVVTTATSAADGGQSASDSHKTSVTEVTFAKYVRNVDTSVVGSGAYTDPIGGATFYTGGVTAKSGETVEYLLKVTNPTGTTAVAGATITDAVPTFTTYVASSTRLNGITVAGDGATSPVAGGLTIDDDTGRVGGVAASGAIASGSSATVTFQVTVD
ncbi:MAG: hypothetical protein COX57_10990 [Alphaproteobacteria bacterium CG_4_10_14_0_2_um_filter_63_37]|nr:MAG: hypothetical protein AUJ55_09335 [Proteobacteria bacterium CG1_02_64_396]PJA23972.1 MAG: hypothetical protein COX57_10990 [Alphaproteobacteria bacterium CG_4_10_14_0_2_um_filter_63_37]